MLRQRLLPQPRRLPVTVHLTRTPKQMARRLRAKGRKLNEISRELNDTAQTIRVTVRDDRSEDGNRDEWSPAPGRLSAEEREKILVGLRNKESMSSIARRWGRVPATITREVATNGGGANYGARRAHSRARSAVRCPKPAKLDHPMLLEQVSTWLDELWSPQEISSRLQLESPDDLMMQVSHETIYQSLFVQGRGELRRELARCLRAPREDLRHGDDLRTTRRGRTRHA